MQRSSSALMRRGCKMNRRSAGRGAKYPLPLRSRVSAEQMQMIRDSAYLAGMSICKYVRERATGSTVVSRQDKLLLRELNRIGNLLVYLTKKGENVTDAIAEIRAAVKKIRGG